MNTQKNRIEIKNVDDLILDFINEGKSLDFNNPQMVSAIAIKAQSTQAILTGYQVITSIRIAEALEKVAESLNSLSKSTGYSAEIGERIVDGLGDIRNTISSNSN